MRMACRGLFNYLNWNFFNNLCFFFYFLFFIFIFEKNFRLVTVPREFHGIFFKGDAYVIYHAEEIKKSSSLLSITPSILIQHIHFWIGSEATQDEAGVAAYKTVELGRINIVFIRKIRENISFNLNNQYFLS